jgi:hypothetical protein
VRKLPLTVLKLERFNLTVLKPEPREVPHHHGWEEKHDVPLAIGFLLLVRVHSRVGKHIYAATLRPGEAGLALALRRVGVGSPSRFLALDGAH